MHLLLSKQIVYLEAGRFDFEELTAPGQVANALLSYQLQDSFLLLCRRKAHQNYPEPLLVFWHAVDVAVFQKQLQAICEFCSSVLCQPQAPGRTSSCIGNAKLRATNILSSQLRSLRVLRSLTSSIPPKPSGHFGLNLIPDLLQYTARAAIQL